MPLKFLLLMITSLGLFACSAAERDALSNSAVSEEKLGEIETKEQLESIITAEYIKTNASGEVTEIKGLTPADSIKEGSGVSQQDLRESYANEEKVFEFIPPEGVSTEFSEPTMITGASLLLANNFAESCKGLAYKEKEPSYRDIVDAAASQNICGSVEVSFCMRMLPAGLSKSIKSASDYVYAKTPGFTISIPCKTDSFKDLSIAIAGGSASTNKTGETVHINANYTVAQIYLTNTADCSQGGEWQAISTDKRPWGLEIVDNAATVYAKFKDIYGAESECISDSILYAEGSGEQGDNACFAGDPNYKAENILAGIKIGDLEGSAVLDYVLCTEDGQTGCIASSDYQAASASGLAAKTVSGQNVGGVVGTAMVETHSPCTAGGQADCIATSTFISMDLSSKDADSAVDLTSANFSTQIKTAATLEFWDETGARFTAAGDADITAANILNGTEIFGVTGTAGAPPDCRNVSSGGSIPDAYGTWILVPGNPEYGTNDFCLMKYEAKNNSGVPASTAAGTPWVSIDQQDAKTECASLGNYPVIASRFNYVWLYV